MYSVGSISVTTPYNVLGVSTHSDDEAIRTAFRKAAKQLHPDLNPGDPSAERRFKRLIRARDLLLNSKRRSAWRRLKKPLKAGDLLLDSGRRSANAQRQARRQKKYTLATIGVTVLVALAAFNLVFTGQSVSFDLGSVKLASAYPDETYSTGRGLPDAGPAEIKPGPGEAAENNCANEALSGRTGQPCTQKRAVPAARMSPPRRFVRSAAKAFRGLALKLQSVARAGM
jgi:hypothetical protein